MTKEERIEFFIKNYPIGTVYVPPHIDTDDRTVCTIRHHNILASSEEDIWLSTGNLLNGHNYSEIVYNDESKRWARIISLPDGTVPNKEITNYAIY